MAKRQNLAQPDTAVGAGGNRHDAAHSGERVPEPPPKSVALADSDNGSGTRLTAGRNGDVGAANGRLSQVEIQARVRKLALRQLNRLVALEPKVLRDEFPDAVHDLRVASRRLQSLLDFLFTEPRPRQIRKLRRRLKQAHSVLGELRNQDALVARMARVLGRKRAARREAWEAGRDYVSQQRSKTVDRAHRELSRLNLAQVYVRLRQELATLEEPEDVEPAASSAQPAAIPGQASAEATEERHAAYDKEKNLAARFSERLRELWQDFDALAAKSRRDPGVLHPLRIATKRLRYLVEVAAALNVAGSFDALRWLRNLQRKLGDWHDLEVLDSMLIDMLARRKFLQGNLPLAIAVEKLMLGLRVSKARQCHPYLRSAFQSAAYRQTAAWVNQSALQGLPAR